MNAAIRFHLLLLATVLLAACGSHAPAPVEDRLRDSGVKVYQVQRGDTLYSIAFRYGLDYRQVAEVNSIADPYLIYPGHHLYLWETPGGPIDVTPDHGAATVVSGSPGLPADYTPSAVVVTAVPGVASAPISEAGRPPSPVYQNGAKSGAQQAHSVSPQIATANTKPNPPTTQATKPLESRAAETKSTDTRPTETKQVAVVAKPAPVTGTGTI
ncbi:MAG: LysM peptidoglycan-binding domain-containing protein, partial [Pseudomonadota bacterium]